MELAPKHKQFMLDHLDVSTGTFQWRGSYQADMPIIIINGQPHDARLIADAMGIKIAKNNKYTGKTHAGMGKLQSGTDTSDAGNGTSQDTE